MISNPRGIAGVAGGVAEEKVASLLFVGSIDHVPYAQTNHPHVFLRARSQDAAIVYPVNRPSHVEPDDSAGFLRQVLECDVEERHIRMLEFQLLLSNRKRTVADGEQLFLVEKQLPLVVHRPLEFTRHAEGITGHASTHSPQKRQRVMSM